MKQPPSLPTIPSAEPGFRYALIPNGLGDRDAVKLWAASEFIQDGVLHFPVQNAQVTQTARADLVLAKGKGTVFLVLVSSGDDGTAEITEVEQASSSPVIIRAKGRQYPGCGEIAWALIECPEGGPVLIRGVRTGLGIGAERAISFTAFPDGRIHVWGTDWEAQRLLSGRGGF